MLKQLGKSNTKNTRAHANYAILGIYNNLLVAYNNNTNLELLASLQYAAFDAGVAFTKAYVGYVHAIAHNLGGFYGIPHGLANAVILPYVLEYYGETAHARLAKLAVIAGLDTKGMNDEQKAKLFIASIKEFNKKMNIPDKLDILEKDIPTIAKRAAKEGNPLYPVPKIMDIEDCKALIKKLQK